MADAAEGKKEKKKGGLGKVIAIFFVILILLVAGFVAALKFDVAGLGTEIIGPQIKDIPFASIILPEMPEEEVFEGEEGAGDTVQYETLEQAVEILKVTENLLKEKEEEAEKLNEQLNQQQEEIDRLKEIEDQYLQFEADKAAFDQAIVDGTDSSAFATWYESMYPDNAAAIYATVIGEQADEAAIKAQAARMADMKPDAAAAILTETAVTRLEMVATIIEYLDPDTAGDILGAMDPSLASRILVYLHPEQQQ